MTVEYFKARVKKLEKDLSYYRRLLAVAKSVDRESGEVDDVLERLYFYINSISGIDIKSKKRFQKYVWMRCLFYNAAFKVTTDKSEIGRFLNKDRTTVLWGLEKYNELISLDKEFQQFIKPYNDKLKDFFDNEIH